MDARKKSDTENKEKQRLCFHWLLFFLTNQEGNTDEDDKRMQGCLQIERAREGGESRGRLRPVGEEDGFALRQSLQQTALGGKKVS